MMHPLFHGKPSHPSQPSRPGVEPRCEGFSEGVNEETEPSQLSPSDSGQLREGFPSEQEPSQDFEANREGCDSCEGFRKDTEEKIGMSIREVLALWTAEGRPVIHLGPGENCFDLERLLDHRDINPRHLAAIHDWLMKREAARAILNGAIE